MRRNGRRVFVVGLDCLAPAFAFEQYLDTMPFFAQLLDESTWGIMRSCDPPITVPAWMVMVTGVDPGRLGAYGLTFLQSGSGSPRRGGGQA